MIHIRIFQESSAPPGPNECNMLDSALGIERSGYKIYPQSLENERAPYWFSEKMACDRLTLKRCFAAIALLEMLEEEDDINLFISPLSLFPDMILLAKYVPQTWSFFQ